MRNIFKISVLVYAILLLAGCNGSSPQVYKETIKTDTELTDSEKYSLITIVLQENINKKLGKSKRWKGNCVKYNSYQYHYDNCFNVEGDIFYRVDDSTCSSNRKKCKVKYTASSQKYIDFIDNFQTNILKENYLIEEKNYKKFLVYYNKAIVGLAQKRKNLKVILKDPSNNLDIPNLDAINNPTIRDFRDSGISANPNNVYERFRLGTDGEQVLNDINSYFVDGKKLSDVFYIQIYNNKKEYGNYIWTYNQSFKKGYLDTNNTIVFTIKDIKYNYIPETFKFYSEDKDLEITVTYIKSSYEYSPKYTFTIKNNRKTSVEVSDPNYYYGDKIQKELLYLKDEKITIAPMSKYSTVVSLDYFGEFIEVKNKDQKIKFGFYLEYKFATDSNTNSLYHVEEMIIPDNK